MYNNCYTLIKYMSNKTEFSFFRIPLTEMWQFWGSLLYPWLHLIRENLKSYSGREAKSYRRFKLFFSNTRVLWLGWMSYIYNISLFPILDKVQIWIPNQNFRPFQNLLSVLVCTVSICATDRINKEGSLYFVHSVCSWKSISYLWRWLCIRIVKDIDGYSNFCKLNFYGLGPTCCQYQFCHEHSGSSIKEEKETSAQIDSIENASIQVQSSFILTVECNVIIQMS